MIETDFNKHYDWSSSSLEKPQQPGILSGERRVLCVMRWPVGGIRTYINYNYPALAGAGYRFTFVGPEINEFRDFAQEPRDWDEVEFVGAPVEGTRCRLVRLRQTASYPPFRPDPLPGDSSGSPGCAGERAVGSPSCPDIPRRFPSGPCPRIPGAAQGLAAGLAPKPDRYGGDRGRGMRLNHLEYLPRLAKNPGRVVTIKPGIDSEWYAEMDQMACAGLRERLHISPGTFLIGFLGRFMEQKGFLPLLDALGSLKNDPPRRPYHVVAVGGGDYEAEYRREVERRGLDTTVSFHEFVPDPRSTFQALDLLVMPSLWEALPVLPMEAMAVGTPVLGTDCIGLHEVLTGTPATMVPAGDLPALARALKDAIDNPTPELARQFAPEARRRFDVRASSAKLLKLFDGIILERCQTRVAVQPCIPGRS